MSDNRNSDAVEGQPLKPLRPKSKRYPLRNSAIPNTKRLQSQIGELLSERPLLIRTALLRQAYADKDAEKKYRSALAGRRRVGRGPRWCSLCVTIPKEILDITGLEKGMTLVIEGHLNKRVVLYPAGDTMTEEDLMI